MNLPKATRHPFCYAIALLGLIAGSHLQAQNTPYGQQTMSGTAPNTASSATIRSYNSGTVGVKGTPMVLAGWAPGELTLQSGNKITSGQFNYDVVNRMVAIRNSPRDSVGYESTAVKELILHPAGEASTLRYEHMPNLLTDETALKTDLLRIIHKGAYSLVELPVKTFVKAPTKQTYGGLGEVSTNTATNRRTTSSAPTIPPNG